MGKGFRPFPVLSCWEKGETMKKEIEFDKSSQLQAYAYKWLRSRGLFDEDSDYDGMLGEAILELVKVFSKQRHSGFSAGLAKEMFYRLLADYESGQDADYNKRKVEDEK